MHACQIGLTDTAPLCPGSPHRACVMTREEHFEADNFYASIFPLLLKCEDGATTPSLYFGSWAWVVNWLPDISEVDQPGSSSSPIAGLLTTNGGGGNGEVQYWVPLSLLHYLHLAAHCQSDKGSHLIPSVGASQHNWDHRCRV